MNPSFFWRIILIGSAFFFCNEKGAAAADASFTDDVLHFKCKTSSQEGTVSAAFGQGQMRVDQPEEKFAVIYEDAPQKFTGIEIRDGQYWIFTWPEVEAEIQHTHRYEQRMQDLNIEGLASYDLTRPETQKVIPPPPLYLWRTTGEKQKIGSFFCEKWVGESATAPQVEVWCVEQSLPHLKEDLDRLKKINETMALVPVHPLLPEIYFPIVDSLAKAGVIPVQVNWAASSEKNQITFLGMETKTLKSSFFNPPTGYIKVQLIALEGLIDDKTEKNSK